MKALLPHLFRGGVTGTASVSEQRVLEFLAWGPRVNQRIFGQPLSSVCVYYEKEYRKLLLGREESEEGAR